MKKAQDGESEIMAIAQADKRALSRLLAGLVLCTLLTGFAAITVTNVAVSAANGPSGYDALRVSAAETAK
ncbi:MAG: hypothetical protein C0605_15645 [Hyphomicrobiales bacterium]|nr:MAG: hypothetical protein C0605_15645 [Hyphomicrobiales bacterium]